MSDLNIYAAHDFSYDFSKTHSGYLTNLGLSDTLTPSDPDKEKVFEFKTPYALTSAAVVLFSYTMPVSSGFHLVVLDQDNVPIPGTETISSGSAKCSRYTFTTPVEVGTILKFQVESTELDTIRDYVFCNATIHTSS